MPKTGIRVLRASCSVGNLDFCSEDLEIFKTPLATFFQEGY